MMSKRTLELWIAELQVACLAAYFNGEKEHGFLSEWKYDLVWTKYTGKFR